MRQQKKEMKKDNYPEAEKEAVFNTKNLEFYLIRKQPRTKYSKKIIF